MTLSVIIPAHNDRDHLTRLQEVLGPGLKEHGIDAEIVVVANGCTDGTEEVCRKAGFTCLSIVQSLSPAAARNAGVEASTGEWLAFVDADVVPQRPWFAAVAKLMDSAAGDVAVGWPYLVPPGWHWLAPAWERVRMAGGRLPRYINSGNLVVRRALFNKIGGFDRDRIAGEDVDFCRRIQQAGGSLTFDSEMLTYHYGESRSARQFLRRQLFHAEPLGVVLRDAFGSPTNAAICLIAAGALAGVALAILGWSSGWRYATAFLLLGPCVLLVMAVAKAASGWGPSTRLSQFVPMVAACGVMLTARTIGTVWRYRN